MREVKNLRKSRAGFSLVSILIDLAILSITALVFASFMNDFFKQTNQIESKNKALGLASELRSTIELPAICSQFIDKVSFTYPGLQPNGSIVPNNPDKGLPLKFNLASGIVTEGPDQTSPVRIESFRMLGATLIDSDQNQRVYAGRLVLSAAPPTNSSRINFAPFLIGAIILTVDGSTNKIMGCAGSPTSFGLCAALGGKYDPNAIPICDFLKICPQGEALTLDNNGLPICTSIAPEIGKICPASTFFRTNLITGGTPDVLCKSATPPIERVIITPPQMCHVGKNQYCAITFNYKTFLNAAYLAKPLKNLRLKYYAFGSGSGSCMSRYTVNHDITGGSKTVGGCGKKCSLSTSTINTTTGDVHIDSYTAGWGSCKGGGCNGCVSDVRMEFEF